MKSLGILLTLATVLLSACTLNSSSNDGTGPDERVTRENPTVITEPANAPARPFKAVILPFSAQGSNLSSKGLTAAFADAWTHSQAFASVDYASDQAGLTGERAILMARNRGADCLVIGRLGALVDGGEGEESTASLSLEILDVNSGQAIWSMTASGRMSPGGIFSFFRRKDGASEEPLKTIVAALAYDTGAIIKKWNTGAAYKTPGAIAVPVSIPSVYVPPPPPKKPLHVKDLSR